MKLKKVFTIIVFVFVANLYFQRIIMIEKTGRVDFDFIKGGSVLFEVFITNDGKKYLLSWDRPKGVDENLRGISSELSYFLPFGEIQTKVKGYKSWSSLFWPNLSKHGRLPKFVMKDFKILNTIENLSSKNTYLCLDDNTLKAHYISMNEQRSGWAGPAKFVLEFPEGEETRIINLIQDINKISTDCWNDPTGCDRELNICELAKTDSRYNRCTSLFLDCSSGSSSALRLDATGEGYFEENSIAPHFRVESYNINDLGGAYSGLVASFKKQLN